LNTNRLTGALDIKWLIWVESKVEGAAEGGAGALEKTHNEISGCRDQIQARVEETLEPDELTEGEI
jgi:hypothetical protein